MNPDEYAFEVERAKRLDPAADYTRMRLAFAASANRGTLDAYVRAQRTMKERMDAGDFGGALQVADAALALNFVHVHAHSCAAYASMSLGDFDRAQFHFGIRRQLLDSIASVGDGQSIESAYNVITVPEEYALLQFSLRATAHDQALLHVGGHAYDQITYTDIEAGEPKTLYFNIDIHLRQLEEPASGVGSLP